LADRLDAVRQRPPLPTPTSVLVLEWPDPLWSAGHWVPEMVSLAGGHPLAGLAGQPSTRLTEREFEEHSPDVVIVAGCGYDLDRNIQEGRRIADRWAWRGDIFAVDANAFFSRPGPRLLDGVELLANLLRGVPVDEKAARRLTP
jgi:iron complex transport system substrate-binding protein